VGILADLYRNATWAFIGGSFKSKVHSVMEPLCCAIPVITGPRIHNSPEAMKYNNVIMNELRVVQVANDSNEFLSAISALKDIQIKDFKKMLIGHLEQNRYASVRIVRIILDMFQETLNS
jgi:3-deoxy-D-manno-octulosonic-acid transferase